MIQILIEQGDNQPCLNPPVRLPAARPRAVFMVGWVGRLGSKAEPPFLLLVQKTFPARLQSGQFFMPPPRANKGKVTGDTLIRWKQGNGG
jgi:hypothetical protein